MQHVLIGNFGNHSLAALQYLIERQIEDLHFLYVNTGWNSASWLQRVEACTAYAESRQVQVHALSAVASFSAMVRDRKQFPSQKFQWCASFLKGLTLLNHLDEKDPFCQALIISGKRRADSRRFYDLPEYQEDDKHYNGRNVWHPLWQTSDDDFYRLIKKSGFDVLPHASQECSPCIHLAQHRLGQLDAAAKDRLDKLEKELNTNMFAKPIGQYVPLDSTAAPKLQSRFEQFDQGCGSAWCCGE